MRNCKTLLTIPHKQLHYKLRYKCVARFLLMRRDSNHQKITNFEFWDRLLSCKDSRLEIYVQKVILENIPPSVLQLYSEIDDISTGEFRSSK